MTKKSLQALMLSAGLLASCGLVNDFFNPKVKNNTPVTYQTQEEPIAPNESEPVRDDFNINLELESYFIGSYLNFSLAVQNKTNSNIFIDNTDRNSLEYKLIKEEIVLEEKLKAFKLTIYPTGYIKTKYKNNNLETEVWGVKLDTGKVLDIPTSFPFPLTLNTPYNSFQFTESGLYTLQANLVYEIDGKDYDCSFEKEVNVK